MSHIKLSLHYFQDGLPNLEGLNFIPPPKKDLWINDTRKTLWISYLAAISTITTDVSSILKNLEHIDKLPTFSSAHTDCFKSEFLGQWVSGALQVAIDDINSNSTKLKGHKLNYLFGNTCGKEEWSRFFLSKFKSIIWKSQKFAVELLIFELSIKHSFLKKIKF